MSLECMSRVWKHATCSGTSLVCLLALADWANQDDICWYSVISIAERCRNSERSAQYLLNDLEAGGQIFVKAEIGQNNYYMVAVGLTEVEIRQRLIRALKFARKEADEISADILRRQLEFAEKYTASKKKQGLRMLINGGVQPIAPPGATHCIPPVQPIAPDPTLIPNDPKYFAASADAAPRPPTPSIKEKSSRQPKDAVALCDIFHLTDGGKVMVYSNTMTKAAAESKIVEISAASTLETYVLVRNGKEVAWYRGGHKVGKPREIDPLVNAIATFCFKATTQAAINANAGHIAGAGTKKLLMDYLREIKNLPPDAELSDTLIGNTAETIAQGFGAVDSMGKWWDDNHVGGDGKPIARPAPNKFMIYYPLYREYALAKLSAQYEPAKPTNTQIRWIKAKSGELVRPYNPDTDGIPGQYTLVYADPPVEVT